MNDLKNNKKLLFVGLATIAALVFMVVALLLPKEPKIVFDPPPFEEMAEQGSPDVSDQDAYREFYQEGMACRVKMNAAITFENEKAIVYFTNPSENDVWLKLRILDVGGKILGETGILRPGEYVRFVKLFEQLPVGSLVCLKVMGYEPDTYHSVGAVTINSIIN